MLRKVTPYRSSSVTSHLVSDDFTWFQMTSEPLSCGSIPQVDTQFSILIKENNVALFSRHLIRISLSLNGIIPFNQTQISYCDKQNVGRASDLQENKSN